MQCQLDAQQTTSTIELLSKRIDERFPGSGLGKVCSQLCVIANASKQRAEK